MDAPAMRPRSVGEILDAAIKLYLSNARVLMGSALAVVVPLQIVTGIVLLSTYSNGRDISTGLSSLGSTVTPAEAHARLGASAINDVMSLVAGAFVLAACVKALSDAYLGQPASVRGSLRFGLGRLLPLIGLEILYLIAISISFILLIVPGIWLYCAWCVRVPVLVIERRNPFRSLGRSRRLVKGRWWATAAVLLVAQVMVLLVGGIIVGALTAAALADGRPSVLFAVLISVLAAIVSSVILQPFAAAVTTVLYYDLRIRHEGYDLELLADQLGLPSADLPAGADSGFRGPVGPEHVGQPGGPPFWPPPPGWQPGD